ncbi:hypothetical protein BWK59_03550 [Flavobacterium davisii]|uniref:MORN repeat variant n=1 Tax=Flavobacterium davisii TaxID=2906077 RepID=A0A246GKD5_9FLAO|nr:hypothetical protein [Flavobacterium davisii]OWP84753.1 hypothetical protein BWK59_03550 [Flavobacterium davisii]
MKTSTLKSTFLFFTFLLLCSFQDSFLIKRISDKDFRYEFFTTNKKKKPDIKKEYFWFKGGMIHHAQYGSAGELLDGKFSKFYHSNQLAEQGTFRKGLRIKEWKFWHPNGKISSIQHWASGVKHGVWLSFDSEGKMIESGFYKNNLKSKTWINYERKDTLVYKKGEIVTSKIKKEIPQKTESKESKRKTKTIEKSSDTTKPSFFKRLFSKKNKTHDAQGT